MAIETPDQAATSMPIMSHWIDGRAVDVPLEGTGPIFNPDTGQVIGRVPHGGAVEVDAAVAAAAAAFPKWRDMPLIARSQILFAYRELLWQHREELAALISRDHGKTFPDGLAEVTRGMETVEFACGLPVHLAGLNTPNVSSNLDAYTLRGPLGVTAGITPFNFPRMVAMWIYPIAMAAGNTFVWKPSSHTPGATQLQAELWKQAGLPDGVFNVVYGGREAVTAICEHPDVKAIRFRGLHAGGQVRLRDGDPARQARRRLHRGQERDDRPAGRGHGPRRGRCRGRWLRLGRRAVHGPDAADRRRPHGGAHPAAHPRPRREAEDRPGHGARERHGPDLLR